MKFIGEVYREKILSLPEQSLHKIELLYYPENFRVEKDLFGWKLFYTRFGRKTEYFLECRSEEEARFLKLFFELGLLEIQVPKDEEYLKSILPELERLKAKTDEILDPFLEGLLNRRDREKLKHEVYMEVVYSSSVDSKENG